MSLWQSQRRSRYAAHSIYRHRNQIEVLTYQGPGVLFANSCIGILIIKLSVSIRLSLQPRMAGYLYSCPSIKLIHWGAPERDVQTFFVTNSFIENLYFDSQMAKKLSELKPRKLRNLRSGS